MSRANIVLPLTWSDEAISSPCQPEYAVIGHQGVLWLPKNRSQKNRQMPFSGASFEIQEPV